MRLSVHTNAQNLAPMNFVVEAQRCVATSVGPDGVIRRMYHKKAVNQSHECPTDVTTTESCPEQQPCVRWVETTGCDDSDCNQTHATDTLVEVLHDNDPTYPWDFPARDGTIKQPSCVVTPIQPRTLAYQPVSVKQPPVEGVLREVGSSCIWHSGTVVSPYTSAQHRTYTTRQHPRRCWFVASI